MTKDELDSFIMDVQDLGVRIENIDNLIKQIDREELRDKYTVDLLAMVDSYNAMCALLELEIERYMEEQKKSGSNVDNLVYRRVLKTLKH